jgi:phenylpropionate dioxygenase-like ring-hydroxylating dioxygenase large terminal subunit
MLKNFWYACEFSQSVTAQPKQIVMFNQRLVLYRTTTGEVVALNDQCPHRGAALSLGKVSENCIRCPYHGWEFRSDGQCTDIPSLPSGTAFPRGTRVKSYPTQEKYGFVWLFYGEKPSHERLPLPQLPEHIFSTMYPVSHEGIEDASYTRLMQANLDFAHAIAVHKSSFGQRIPINEPVQYSVQQDERSAVASVKYSNLGNSKSLLNRLLGGRPDLTTRLSFYLPNVTLAEISIGRNKTAEIKFAILVAFIPIDDNTTCAKRFLYRNKLRFPILDPFVRKLDHKLAYEDTVVVRTIPTQVMPPISEELHVGADKLDLTFRKLHRRYATSDELVVQ